VKQIRILQSQKLLVQTIQNTDKQFILNKLILINMENSTIKNDRKCSINKAKIIGLGGLMLSLILVTGCYSMQNTASHGTAEARDMQNNFEEEPSEAQATFIPVTTKLMPSRDYFAELDSLMKTTNQEAEQGAVLYTVSTDSIEAARKEQELKERQTLNQKYGKKYVDALLDKGEILVGAPEGLIKNHTQSTLINETQYTRTYKIKGWLNDWGASVDVNVKTGKVTAVRNRTL